MRRERFMMAFVLLLVLGITVGFVLMLRPFLMTLLMAAIMAGVVQPLQRWSERLTRGRRSLAAALTLAVFVAGIVVPLLSILGIVASQAYDLSQKVFPWIQGVRDGTVSLDFLERLPFAAEARAHSGELLARGSQLLTTGSRILVQKLSSLTTGTVHFVFQFIVFLYSMFFFLKDGRVVLGRILYYMPLDDADEERMIGKFRSVARAMLKGTLVIALLQGTLTGIAIAIAGIHGAVFLGTVAVVLAMIPGVGTSLVWGPCAIYLFACGRTGQAVFLLVIGAGVVGLLDNFLRPRLVGRDTQMHDLLIFFGTLGGLFLFGLPGLLLGPILTALFVTIWEIYGVVFRDYLPQVQWLGAGPAASTPAARDPQEDDA